MDWGTMSLIEINDKIIENVKSLENHIRNQIDETLKLIEKDTEEYKLTAQQGDFSENAAFNDAKKSLSLRNAALSRLEDNLDAIQAVDEYTEYKSIGMVTCYSVVKFRQLNTDEVFIFKLFPAGVSDITKGIMAVDSGIGKELLRKSVGSIITVHDSVLGVGIKYEIIDIY